MTKPPAAPAKTPQRQWLLKGQGWFDRWLKRRAQARPPLTIQYRQIFILPTRFGWMLGLLMFAMLMGSLNFNNNLGLLTTFIVAALALNSMLLAYHNLRGIRILRCQATAVHAGDIALLSVSFNDSDGRQRPALELNSAEHCHGFDLLRGARVDAVLPVQTNHRGWKAVGRLRLQTSYPMGLFEAWAWFWPDIDIRVWPRPADNAPPLPRHGQDAVGRHSTRRPDSDTFHSLRAWRPEDPLHRIAWKASQRHQALLAREFRAEASEHVILDLEMTPASDLELRLSILTAWVLQAHHKNLEWSLKLGHQQLGPGRGEAHRVACLNALSEFGL